MGEAVNKEAAITWNTVGEICGRKTSNKSKINAAYQSERSRISRYWKRHKIKFENLLGKVPIIRENQPKLSLMVILTSKMEIFAWRNGKLK